MAEDAGRTCFCGVGDRPLVVAVQPFGQIGCDPGVRRGWILFAYGKERKVSTGKRAVVEVGFHSLRHTFVSLCREANAPLAVVEAIVGHSNPAMTRHYTHTSEAAAGAAVAALPDITSTSDAKPALPAADPAAILKSKLSALVETLTPANAVTVRAQMLALLEKH